VGFTAKPLIIAVNKVDLVEDYEGLVEEVRELAESVYPWTKATLPTSAKTGFNVEELAYLAIKAAKEAKALRDIKGFEGEIKWGAR
jgi:50S ribosomal subunit-associated GTPase HflX